MSTDFIAVPPESFSDLNLHESLLKAVVKTGYTTPTPIQAKMIPHVLAGQDVVGQAQTGTGKTAAFALPLLHQLSPGKKARPQVLVLTPTRELAIQVAEAFQTYALFMKHIKVLPVYGGQDYAFQLQHLKRGVNIVVGTPGRIMDHIRRGSLNLTEIKSFVLDEADEMLKMGFLDDVEWILDQAPAEKQIALFSATMPATIRRIAKKHLNSPVEITIKDKTATAPNTKQSYLITQGFRNKTESLERILEMEQFEGILIFVRTKVQTVELAEHLAGLGYACGPLNGDIPQNQRLRMVEHLKSGKLDIVVATDVAARGLDVERISHVINFDVPFDTEAYIHRIGRTGRAGRDGKAILFLASRERSMLKSIERATRQKIDLMRLPTIAEINSRRIESYKSKITSTLAADCSFFARLVEEYCRDNDQPVAQVAAALAKMGQEKSPLLREEPKKFNQRADKRLDSRGSRGGSSQKRNVERRTPSKRRINSGPEEAMDRYRIEIGSTHGIKPGNIVGAIANEADISSEHIGRISIFDDYSTVDLPYGMPSHTLRLLQKTRIHDRTLQIRKEEGAAAASGKTSSSNTKRKIKIVGGFEKAPRRKGQNKNRSSSPPSSK
jgi:ATP-dependent RNA helicase DeaD